VNRGKGQPSAIKSFFNSRALFPLATLVLYGVVTALTPEKALLALKSSMNVLLQMVIPLLLIFVLMVLVNLFLKPAKVAKFLGKGSGIKAMLLSAAAGIISAGPIYAWYPLLKDLREKGAENSLIAIFLYNRSVKPFLLPVMIAYFGWIYVAILAIMTVFASFVVGCLMNLLLEKRS